jgi:cytochrome b subunit of formate dehydrogenase
MHAPKKEQAMKKNILNYLLDAVIAAAFLMAGATGIAFLFLGSGGFQGGRNPGFAVEFLGLERGVWSDLHDLAGLVMIAGIAVHLILHWRWIVCTTRQIVSRLFRRAVPVRAAAAE